MARINGVDLPRNKQGEVALTYIYGVGRSTAQKVLDKAGVDRQMKVEEWNDDNINAIRQILSENYKLEGELRSETQLNIKRLMDIGCYRYPSPYRTPGQGPEHQEQCSYPQRTQEDRGKQEKSY